MVPRNTKYLITMGELKRKDNSLSFVNEKGNNYIPIENVREIYCMNEISINTKLLDFLGRAGVIVHFFNYYNLYSGTFYPKDYLISGKLLIKQVDKFNNNRLVVAKAFVKSIAMNIHEVLYHYYRHGKSELKDYLDWIKNDAIILIEKSRRVEELLFVEGEIWKKFYSYFKLFLHEDFWMNSRVRRPPDNPINALISFGNSMIYTKTITEIFNTHLNPSISYLHSPSEGRFSLALDISESFKPVIVFKTIFELTNRKMLKANEHFDKKLNYCVLNEKGRNIFVQAFEERLNDTFMHPKLKRKISYKTAIRLDCYKLIKYIVEDKNFEPFNLKELL
ncbi:type I-B CRISPR-associated endonuclease Cas1b [Sedimentibacter sp. MB31-C6]|nr:type I-B CRISPR-associated endonuclease Cas1b [Sedimentibacter sp. MB36-C1]WSI05588.1 type I-B CRISPR-associated endonuclease Cas1b [Sedimentibacter sp. MB36-C1]